MGRSLWGSGRKASRITGLWGVGRPPSLHAVRGWEPVRSSVTKDRPEHRRAFAVKCAALLLNRISVAIVDRITTRAFNLSDDLMELSGPTDPDSADGPPPLHAVACRWAKKADVGLLETWAHPL